MLGSYHRGPTIASRQMKIFLWIFLGTCITGLFFTAREMQYLEGKHPAKTMTIQQKTIRGVDDTIIEIGDHYDYDETEEEESAADAATSLSETKNLPPLVPSEDTAWCPKALLDAGALTQSSSHVWTNLQDKILNATYISHPHMELMNATVLHDYKEWIDQLFSYYTNSKLRRSVMNAAPPKQIVELLKLAEEIKRFNAQIDKDESSSNEEDGKAERRYLRILILGGSVTAGVNCFWPEVLGIKHGWWATPGEKCAWPHRLEPLLNHVLFGGEDVVKVDNLSTGGQTSESGTMILDYRLFPDPDYLPDVVIPAYSANEAREGDLDRVLYYLMQNFVEAAQHLHPCNDQKPLIMNVDDFYGLPFGALRQTAKIFMISKWNNIMAVDYASTVKYKLQAEVHEDNSEFLPLLHSNYNLHSGIGMHTGIAWTVLFNMVNSIVNVCNDRQIEVESHTLPNSLEESQGTEDGVDSSSGNSTKDYDGNNATYTSSGSIVDATVSTGKHAVSTGNLVNPDLAANLQIEEPPFQHFGRIDETSGDVNKIRHDLQHNINATREFCKTKSSETNKKEEPKCTHAWFVCYLTGFNNRVVLDNIMNSVLIVNEGWTAEGYPVRQPRIGWNAHTANAAFSIKLENVTVDTKFISVLSMKSYSEQWKNSKLAISTTVVQNSTIPMDMETNRTSKVDWSNEETLSYIDGYHEIKTSVFFLHKFPIVEGARKGDSVIVDMKLVQGSEFKITSIALCSS